MTNYGEATGSKFRLSICLKRMYSDERRRCYIAVFSGLRVRWLAKRLRRLFSLSGHFCLVSDGHLLPPDESLALLSPDDVVEVIPKHYRIFEETSENEDELAFDINDNNSLNTENEESRSIHEQIKTAEINKPQNEKTDDPLTIQNVSNSIPGESYFSFLNQKLIKDTEISQEVEARELNKVDNDQLDAVRLLDQCSFPQKRKRIEENRNSQDIEHGKLDEMDKNELDEVKQKALELLDKCSKPQTSKEIEEIEIEDLDDIKMKPFELVDQRNMPEKRKRKRVRRRKPRTVVDSEDVVDATENHVSPQTPNNHSGEMVSPLYLSDPMPKVNSEMSTLSETQILRNNTDQNRTARLVYSLS